MNAHQIAEFNIFRAPVLPVCMYAFLSHVDRHRYKKVALPYDSGMSILGSNPSNLHISAHQPQTPPDMCRTRGLCVCQALTFASVPTLGNLFPE
ncbi:d2728dc0-e646-47c4-a9b3-10bcd1b76c19 [Sclerotinia trifoliorum]|uniref:D2728dc0-e646-47c4-a9b3-10bcd1b76c19 n=1 Tax=Sclerotinia trifoliorum TaxID=28548 RepID=A0A8H2ZRF9_9HELO|nr:d2728dc0-e646-47c4-a9b3-10bcd1b76c19 [Sclerotinia trifoliorum]